MLLKSLTILNVLWDSWKLKIFINNAKDRHSAIFIPLTANLVIADKKNLLNSVSGKFEKISWSPFSRMLKLNQLTQTSKNCQQWTFWEIQEYSWKFGETSK